MQFTFSKQDAKPFAKALEQYFGNKGVMLSKGQALDALAAMQGFSDWNSLSAKLSVQQLDKGLTEAERAHAKGAQNAHYTDEHELRAHTGFALRYDALEEDGLSYVRIVDPLGREIAYWVADEWQEAPELVMGAIVRHLVRDAPLDPGRTIKDAKRKGDRPVGEILFGYAKANLSDSLAAGPGWVKFRMDERFFERVEALRNTLMELGVESITDYNSAEKWDSWSYPIEGLDSHLGQERLVLEKDGIRFVASVHNTDNTKVESELISYQALRIVLENPNRLKHLEFTRQGNCIIFENEAFDTQQALLAQLLEDGEISELLDSADSE